MAPKQKPAGKQDDPSFEVTPDQLRDLLASGRGQFAEAIREQLGKMVGLSSGYIESLPKPVQERIAYLQEVDNTRTELEEEFEEEFKALRRKYDRLYEPLDRKARDVAAGRLEAPANETAEGKAAFEGQEVPEGIPDFWLTALRTHPQLSEMITEKDAEVLSFLEEIWVEPLHDGEDKGDTEEAEEEEEEEEEAQEGFKLVFAFRDNPFFTNATLKKTYVAAEEHDGLTLQGIEGTAIDWKSGKDVTVKRMVKKPKPGAKPAGRPATKTEPVESFFRWFTDVPELPEEEEEEGEEAAELQEAAEQDFEVAQIIREEIVPHAVQWFTGDALQEDSDEDEDDEGEDDEEEDDEDDDEDDEDDEDESEDEGDAADRRPVKASKPGKPLADSKEQPQECKQQ